MGQNVAFNVLGDSELKGSGLKIWWLEGILYLKQPFLD
jgi:hypothetical protein